MFERRYGNRMVGQAMPTSGSTCSAGMLRMSKIPACFASIRKVTDKVAFLIEAKQAGIFDIRNIPAEQVDPLVGIACPTILFPYLRSNIADAITRAGFPPIHLAEINFQALYEQRLAQMGGQDGAAQNGVTH